MDSYEENYQPSHYSGTVLDQAVYIRSETTSRTRSKTLKKVEDACQLIEDEYIEQAFKLDEFAERCQLSKFYLIKLFNRHKGVSPQQYAIQCKMDRAHSLLKNSNMPVQDICKMLCYNGASHFTDQFKKIYGKTPTRVRNEKAPVAV